MPQTPEDRRNAIFVAKTFSPLVYSVTQLMICSDHPGHSSSSDTAFSIWESLCEFITLAIYDDQNAIYEDPSAEYMNASFPDGPSFTTQLLSMRLDCSRPPCRPFNLDGQLAQHVFNEPSPVMADFIDGIQPRGNPFSFKECVEMTPRRKAALADARAKAEKEAKDYWIWDERNKNYKHFDKGCSEPVWYNPP